MQLLGLILGSCRGRCRTFWSTGVFVPNFPQPHHIGLARKGGTQPGGRQVALVVLRYFAAVLLLGGWVTGPPGVRRQIVGDFWMFRSGSRAGVGAGPLQCEGFEGGELALWSEHVVVGDLEFGHTAGLGAGVDGEGREAV